MGNRDTELLAAIAGDQSSFKRVKDKLKYQANTLATDLFSDSVQAEDVASKAIDKAMDWLSSDKPFHTKNPMSYLEAVIRNSIISSARVRKQEGEPADKEELSWIDERYGTFDEEKSEEPGGWHVFKRKDAMDGLTHPLRHPVLRLLYFPTREPIEPQLRESFYSSLEKVYQIPTKNDKIVMPLYLQSYRQADICRMTGIDKGDVSRIVRSRPNLLGWDTIYIESAKIAWFAAALARLWLVNRGRISTDWKRKIRYRYPSDIVECRQEDKDKLFITLAINHPQTRPQLANLAPVEAEYLPRIAESCVGLIVEPPFCLSQSLSQNRNSIISAFKIWAGEDYPKLDHLSPMESWVKFWEEYEDLIRRREKEKQKQEKEEREWELEDKAMERKARIEFFRQLPNPKKRLYINLQKVQAEDEETPWSQEERDEELEFLAELEKQYCENI